MNIWVGKSTLASAEHPCRTFAAGNEKDVKEKILGTNPPDGARYELARIEVATNKEGILRLVEGDVPILSTFDKFMVTANGGQLRKDRGQ